MSFVHQLFANRVLLASICGWLSAQLLKAFIYAVTNKEFCFERLIGDGGMPSAHSATVSAMASSVGCIYGWSSPLFGIAVIMAIIVMHDAMGVRRETGKQARIINEMLEIYKKTNSLQANESLKLLVGHTPLQVTAGCFLGTAIGLVFPFLF